MAVPLAPYDDGHGFVRGVCLSRRDGKRSCRRHVGRIRTRSTLINTDRCEMDGRRALVLGIILYREGWRPNLTWPWICLYSSASVHPASDPGHRCSLPGQIRSGQDGRLRPDDAATARTRHRRDFGVGHVSHARACLPDQERVCPIQQVPARGQDGRLLRRDPDRQGHGDPQEQGDAPAHHRRHAWPDERAGSRKGVATRQHQGLCPGRM